MPDDQLISMRAKLPKSAHDKIKSYQRKLAAKHDRFVRFDEALIEFIKEAHIKH